MAIEKINIDRFLLLSKQYPMFDVRSPQEYNHAHIPTANNLPLFTNEERAVVGTAYKQESREKAIKLGLNFFGPKMNSLLEDVEKNLLVQTATTSPNEKIILIYCWRGGMRSAAVAWLLDLYGYKIFTLAGGYKKFRNYVLDTFKLEFNFQILGGYTGSGKTELLQELEKTGNAIIDLEKIANHKGSSFGNIGMPDQPTQEMFENLLAKSLIEFAAQPSSKIWLEDESQRIGLINIPNDIWNRMRKSPVCFLEIAFEERLKHIVEEYGCLDKQKMIAAIERIQQRLGGLETKNAIAHLTNDNTAACFQILLTYYDKWYAKGLQNRKEITSQLSNVPCATVTPLNAEEVIRISKNLEHKTNTVSF